MNCLKTLITVWLMTAILLLMSCSENKSASTDDDSYSKVYDFWEDGPKRPNPVDWGDCPGGWEEKVEKDEDGNLLAKYCEPILPPAGTECEPGYFAMFGSPECQRIGDPCPDGEFADIPNDAGTEIIYVSEGESIQEAIDNAKDGAVIAIGKGTFHEFATITNKNITLWGACIEKTIISPSVSNGDPAKEAVLKIEGTDSEKKIAIKNMMLTGGKVQGIRVAGKNRVDVLKTAIIATARNGIFLDKGNDVSLDSVLIKGTLPCIDKSRGRGVNAIYESKISLNRVVIDGNSDVGIYMGTWDNTELAVLNATDVIVRNTAPQNIDNTSGDGIIFEENCKADLKRVLIENNHTTGITAVTFGLKSVVEIDATHILVRNTSARKSDDNLGIGLHFIKNISPELSKIIVEGNRSSGIYVITDSKTKANLNLEDSVIRNTMSEKNRKIGGSGISLNENVNAHLSRIIIEENRLYGIGANTFSEDTEIKLSMSDITVRKTFSNEKDKNFGIGISMIDNIDAVFTRVYLSENRYAGISAGTSKADSQLKIDLTDVTVKNTLSNESNNDDGFGVTLTDNITAVFTRFASENNRSVGIWAGSEGKLLSLELNDIKISNTLIRECYDSDTNCKYVAEAPFGHGLGVYEGAEVTLNNVVIDNNQNGLQIKNSKVFAGKNCTLSDGDGEGKVCLHLTNNETAINAFNLPDGYNIINEVASDKTWYDGNELDFSGDPQPIPEPADPMDMLGGN